ncbi:MAG: O-antigen ligase family protein [Chitinophagaceae bacterium]|nr:O-antigen ligase family protein [Chitinophagaceae bacterium]
MLPHPLLPPRYRSLLLAALLLAGLFFSRALLSLLMAKGLLLLLFPSFRQLFFARFGKPFGWLTAGIIIWYLYQLLADPSVYTLQRMLFHGSLLSCWCLLFFLEVSSARVTVLILLAGVLSCLPSLVDFWQRPELGSLYEKGQVARTLLKGDHQRFSIWISGCLGLSWWVFLRENKKWAIGFTAFFSLFLLVFSVRTGWLFLLLVTLFAAVFFFLEHWSWRKGLAGLAILLLMGIVAFRVPFVRSKIQYTIWEQREQKQSLALAGSDAVRLAVNKTAFSLIQEQPGGYGSAVAKTVLHAKLEIKHPGLPVKYQWPFSQYLQWWLVAGYFFGSLPLLALLFLLYLLLRKKHLFTVLWTFFIALTCLYESTLEQQYGLFLAAFFGFIFLFKDTNRFGVRPSPDQLIR